MPSESSMRGRRGGLDEARELTALLSSLSSQGRSLSLSTVASRLGCSVQHARLLMELVLTAHDEEGMGLPIGLGDDDELVLAFDGERRGRPLRLTSAESAAMLAALERLGMTEGDAIRRGVRSYLSPIEGAGGDNAARDGIPSGSSASVLDLCAKAIAEGLGLEFGYRGLADGEARERSVLPQTLRTEEGVWYLEGWDLERRAQRTFRLERMMKPRVMRHDATPSVAEGTNQEPPAAREVAVDFLDPSLLDLFSWHGLRVTGESDGRTSVTLPLYAGDWLPLRLAACGSDVVIHDEELRLRTREAARRLRAEAGTGEEGRG